MTVTTVRVEWFLHLLEERRFLHLLSIVVISGHGDRVESLRQILALLNRRPLSLRLRSEREMRIEFGKGGGLTRSASFASRLNDFWIRPPFVSSSNNAMGSSFVDLSDLNGSTLRKRDASFISLISRAIVSSPLLGTRLPVEYHPTIWTTKHEYTDDCSITTANSKMAKNWPNPLQS